MIFSLLLTGAPYSSQSSASAYRFAKTCLTKGHSIYRIFFYHDAVNSGNALITAPQDEADVPQQWRELSQQHNIDLVICVASALKRGVVDQREAARYEKPADNLSEGFDISGLGQLIDATITSDRIVSFGS